MPAQVRPIQPLPISDRQRYLNRWSVLKQQRAAFDAHWQEIGQNFRPRRPRFGMAESDRNKAASIRNDGIINNTPIIAGRTLAAGLQGGLTSPARPWIELTLADRELANYRTVKTWLRQTQDVMHLELARSNIYSSLQVYYSDLGDFGTAVMWIDEDEEDGFRSYTLPVGRYALANSESLRVNTLYRHVPMTVAQVIEKFGYDACSTAIKNAYNLNRLDDWINVLHVTEPNRDQTLRGVGAPSRFKSCWMEETGDVNTGFLREGGYYDCPFLACRWDATSEDVYGFGPGMDALGDAKGLQAMEADKLVMIEKLATPPLTAPTTLQNQPISLVPGKVTYVDQARSGQTVAPVHEVNPLGIQVTGAEIREHVQRINTAYFVDLFMMLANSDRRQITAREIAERHEEKMQLMGPVLERLKDELLDPLVDRVFYLLGRQGKIPPAPPELQGVPLQVKYTSVLVQAQQALGIQQVERFVGFVGSMAASVPEVLDKVDADKVVDEYGSRLGVTPEIIRTDDEVAQIRQARSEAQQAQQQTEQGLAAAQGAKTLSEANLGPDNALGRILQNMGAGGAQA